MQTPTNKNDAKATHYRPTRESYQKMSEERTHASKNTKYMSELFILFYWNKYWKKLLNLKKGWCTQQYQQQQKNHAHKLNDIICSSRWSPHVVKAWLLAMQFKKRFERPISMISPRCYTVCANVFIRWVVKKSKMPRSFDLNCNSKKKPVFAKLAKKLESSSAWKKIEDNEITSNMFDHQNKFLR